MKKLSKYRARVARRSPENPPAARKFAPWWTHVPDLWIGISQGPWREVRSGKMQSRSQWGESSRYAAKVEGER